MRLRFDETTLTKNPKNPISTDVEPAAPPSVANYLDLCHLADTGALPWLFTRTSAQINSAAMIGKVAYDAGTPVQSAALLRHDHNILVIVFSNGTKIAVYPDGAIGHEGQVLACTPEDVQSLLGPAMNDQSLDMVPGMQDPAGGIDVGGMSNLVAPPEPATEELGNTELGEIGDPIEMAEPMIDSEFYGDQIDAGSSPTDEILQQVGAGTGPSDLNLALLDDKGSPMRGERRRR